MPNHKKNNDRTMRTLILPMVLLLAGAVSAQAQDDESAPRARSTSGEYLIGPGDTLNVFVFREPDLSTQIPVRPDGQISTPLVEDMMAVGKTPTELARDIESVLAEYIRSPKVTIIVENFVGTFGAQIRILGQVESPGAVPFRDGMTMLDALLEAGGLTEFAAGNRSRLRRTVDGRPQERRVRLDNLLNKGDMRENLDMMPGDVLVVPEAVF